jgi:hypothetical protein
MAQELLLTYAPSGLKTGTSGFCTVAVTQGTPTPIVDTLELLSGYELPLTQEGAPLAVDPLPPLYAHYLPVTGALNRHFLTCVRIVDNNTPSKRPNKLARHLVMDPAEELAPGPAWVLRHANVFDQPWNGQVRIIPDPLELATGANPPRFCQAWQFAGNDPGWAGVLIEQFLLDASKPIYVVYSPGTNPLELIDEALSLMTPEDRWRVTFSTYFTRPLEGVQCCWRFVLDGTGAAHKARSFRPMGYTVIDLAMGPEGRPKGKYADLARNSPKLDVQAAGAKPHDGWAAVAPADQTDYDAAAAQIPVAPKPPEARFKRGLLFWSIAILWPIITGVLVYNQTDHIRKVELSTAKSTIGDLETKVEQLQKEVAKSRADAEALAQQLTAAQATAGSAPPPVPPTAGPATGGDK